MKQINLDGVWALQGTAHEAMMDLDGKWIPAQVPGDVHVDLMAAGELDDMYYADTIAKNKWTTEKAWWYRREFTVDALDSVTELVFKGIDTVARIYLNDVQIGRTESMLREHRFDVSGKLKLDAPNTLAVCIEPISIVMQQHDAKPYFACFNDHRIFMRKAQFHFGWDWAPNCPGTGIWESVQLETYDQVCLDSHNIKTHCDGAVSFFIFLNDAAKQTGSDGLELKLTARAPDGTPVADEQWPSTGVKNFRNLFIKNPQLWWPNGMGAQPLYTYEISLLKDCVVVESKRGRFGIREVELEEQPLRADKMGFAFVVNGEHCFCKGSNWVPLDSFTGIITDDKYQHMLTLAQEANFNMMRIWGGGIYEKDIFYDLCDELGLMVWQDFMFACGNVPDDQDWFVEEIRKEVVYQVKRLRTHTSLVYWCGGNEKSGSYGQDSTYGDFLVDETIPGILQTLDPYRPYRRDSPYAYEDNSNAPKSGDAHLSALGETFAAGSKGFFDYRNGVNQIDSSFNSEFAIQGPGRRESFEKFMPVEHYWPIDDLWNYRITTNPYDDHDRRTFAEKQLALCQAFFGDPQNHAEFIKYGMTMHAESMWDEVFGYRSKRPFNSGCMFWMYSDPWPTGSWSVVDWYGLPKSAYYAAKRASRPLQIGWKNSPSKCGWQLVACNDTLQSYQGTLQVGEETLTGDFKWNKSLKVVIPANTSIVLVEVGAAEFSGTSDAILFAELNCGDEIRNDVFFPHFWKEADWPEPKLEICSIHEVAAGVVDVTLKAENFARCVHFEGINEGCADGVAVLVEDMFFDLRARETRTIRLKSTAPIATHHLSLQHWLTDWGAVAATDQKSILVEDGQTEVHY
ncbi:MAG: beta-mannosidase [Lentimonas sp.]|jgi:beta-mannosidase